MGFRESKTSSSQDRSPPPSQPPSVRTLTPKNTYRAPYNPLYSVVPVPRSVKSSSSETDPGSLGYASDPNATTSTTSTEGTQSKDHLRAADYIKLLNQGRSQLRRYVLAMRAEDDEYRNQAAKHFKAMQDLHANAVKFYDTEKLDPSAFEVQKLKQSIDAMSVTLARFVDNDAGMRTNLPAKQMTTCADTCLLRNIGAVLDPRVASGSTETLQTGEPTSDVSHENTSSQKETKSKVEGLPLKPNCVACHAMKTKCSRDRPRCLRCTKMDISCIYPWVQAETRPTPANPKSPYEPLKPWQTRLLKLKLADSQSGSLSCHLFPVEFVDMEGVGVSGTSQVISYTALSYTWGRGKFTSSILCNGYPVPIPEALVQFLSRLSNTNTNLYLWCDAICINQQDNAEKAQQVRNILRIFEKAQEVIAWLGEPRGDIPASVLDMCFDSQLSPQTLMDVCQQPHDLACFTGLKNMQHKILPIGSNQWFSRTWVRQEVFAANTLTVQYGASMLPYEDFLRNLYQWMNINPKVGMNRVTFETSDYKSFRKFGFSENFCAMTYHFQHQGVDQVGYRPPAIQRTHSNHWLRVLQEGVSFDVTDERDRVYGVLGIIQSPTTRNYVEDRAEIRRSQFPLSYEKTVSEVYQDVIKYLINTDHNLSVLGIFESHRRLSQDMASWTPDWSKRAVRSFTTHPPEHVNNLLQRHPILRDMQQDLADVGRLTLQGFTPWERIYYIQTLGSDPKQRYEFFSKYYHDHTERVRDQHVNFSKTPVRERPGEGPDERIHRRIYPSLKDYDDAFLQILCDGSYVLSKLQVRPDSSLPNEPGKPTTAKYQIFFLLVPRVTMIDDIIVRFKGSFCLHVIRENPVTGPDDKAPTYTLIGPAVVFWPPGSIPASLSIANDHDRLKYRFREDDWKQTLFFDSYDEDNTPDWSNHPWNEFVLV